MKKILIVLTVLGAMSQAGAHAMYHEMQHGFVLSDNDTFGSHLVASGHHSRQAEVIGQLTIEDRAEMDNYTKRKSLSPNGEVYFLFQAQSLDLPSLKEGQLLIGHIVESQAGKYEPKNIIVKKATFKVNKILLNMINPFFGDE